MNFNQQHNNMRFFLDQSTFISVLLKENNTYSCQIMSLVHGIGMHNAKITDNQSDVVSSITWIGFSQDNKICNSLQEIADYHLQCLLELQSNLEPSFEE